MHLSAPAVRRVLRVARTMADLAEDETVAPDTLAEVISYREETPAEVPSS